MDMRSRENTTPHVELHQGGHLTPAQAKRIRKQTVQACDCRLCSFVKYPVETFEEWEKLMGPSEYVFAPVPISWIPTDARVPTHPRFNEFTAQMKADAPVIARRLANAG